MKKILIALFALICYYGTQAEYANTYTQKILPHKYVDDKIRFIWHSDSHLSGIVGESQDVDNRKMIEDCRLWRPNFMVSSGDFTSSGKIAGDIASTLSYRNALCPWYFAVGNHDEDSKTTLFPETNHTALVPWLGYDAPYNKSSIIYSGDSTFKLLLITLDYNFYNDTNVVGLVAGDRIGDIGYGANRKIFQPQIDWASTAILNSSESNAILLVIHDVLDGIKPIVDAVQSSGKPMILIHGHNHGSYPMETTTSTSGKQYRVLKVPAMLEGHGWARMTFSLSGDSLVIESAIMQNYTQASGVDTLYYPFTMP